MERTEEGPRRRSPSKIRYDRGHPVLGTRVTKADYDAVKAFLAKTGISYAKFVRLALQRESRKYSEAWQAGFQKAKKKYGVLYICGGCGGEIAITTDNEKEAAADYMRSAEWRHGKCID